MAKSIIFVSASLVLFYLLFFSVHSIKIKTGDSFKDSSLYPGIHKMVATLYDDIERNAGRSFAALRAVAAQYSDEPEPKPNQHLIKMLAVHWDKHWSYIHVLINDESYIEERAPPKVLGVLLDLGLNDTLDAREFE